MSANRPDLLALSPDDLAALANRGLLKRAQRELEPGDLTAEWNESDDQTIVAKWSDGVTTTLPGGKTVKDAQCSCGAFELCRHVLRTVLAWQAKSVGEETTEGGASLVEPWDPGRVSDEMVEAQVPKSVRDRARTLWAQGVLAELLRSAKPSARFHCPGHTVRFMVPDDLRYAQCSCADPSPCVHAVLAVKAFRLLEPGRLTGIVSDGPLDVPVPEAPMQAAIACVHEMLAEGLASLNSVWRDRVHRAAVECANASLMWPAQILEELSEDFDHYAARDAAFTPGPSVDRIGELLLRLDAIEAGATGVPQAFIRGMKSDRDSELGAARFIGLGISVAEGCRGSTVNVYLQDCDNGNVVALHREFAEEPGSPAAERSYHQLSRTPAVKDANLALLAAGQLVTQGGRRTASGRLMIGRARAVVNPQSYQWEQLKAPVLVEDFAELSARLQLLPPAGFRPRRAAADFHVCPLAEIRRAAFDPAANAVVAIVVDRKGQEARLLHPWSDRGAGGAEALLAELAAPTARPLFVAGHVKGAGPMLEIRPTACVFAGESIGRHAILPWIDLAPAGIRVSANRSSHGDTRMRYSAAHELAVEILLNGLRRLGDRQWPGWERGITETEECGYHRMAQLLRTISSSRDSAAIAAELLKLLVLSKELTA